MDEQRLAANRQRGHHRQLVARHRGGEGMLFGNLRVGPAAGPVELGDHRRAIVNADLPNPVFVAVERHQGAVATVTDAFNCVENTLGVEPVEWNRIEIGHAADYGSN